MKQFIFGFWLGLLIGLSIIYSIFIYEPPKERKVILNPYTTKGKIEPSKVYMYSYR